MSISANPYSNYRQNQVETADPAELVVMMYNGALNFLRKGKKAVQDKDVEEANRLIARVQDIIAELMGSLDLEAGEVAGNLFNLYEYMYHQLMQANIKKDIALIEEVEKMLVSLKQAWERNRQELQKMQEQDADTKGNGSVNYGC